MASHAQSQTQVGDPPDIPRQSSPSERSPLLKESPNAATLPFGDAKEPDVLSQDDDQRTRSTWYFIALTIGLGGLQLAWATELSNGSPFLLSLGMSKAMLAVVWVAGPLTGVLVQPWIGILSDNCRVSWGRRKPFMIGGVLATAIALLALCWTRELVPPIVAFFSGAEPTRESLRVPIVVWATFWVYGLDFAINTVQAALRAFIVDCAPSHQQERANAWASRILGLGNIIGYFAGNADLPRYFPFLGYNQFQVLCAIAALGLAATVAIPTFLIKERNPKLEGPPRSNPFGLIGLFVSTVDAFRRLPPQTRQVCKIQFLNWIGWFPFLFYISTYVGQLYANPIFRAHPDLDPAEVDRVWEKGTRVGTFALLIFAIVSFASNLILPMLIVPSLGTGETTSMPESQGVRQWSTYLQIPGLTIRRAWIMAHVLFALCMAATVFVYTTTAAVVLTGIVGVAWALTLWAPFALISAEVSQRGAERRARGFRDACARHAGGTTSESTDAADEEAEDQAGVILGLHNVAVSAPQLVATLISSCIFRLTQQPRGSPDDDSVGWVLRFGGLAALFAAWATVKLEEKASGRSTGRTSPC